MASWTLHKADMPLVDALVDRYRREPFVMFSNDGEKLAFIRKLMDEKTKGWSRKGLCYFPSCQNQSIKNSHSLSNKMMIHPIADNGHVLTPQIKHYKGAYELVSVGVNEASVFPGFCEEHESAFTFEKDGLISNERELQMQLFRAICRDLHFLKNEQVVVSRNRDELSERLKTDLKKQLEQTPPKETSISEIVSGIVTELLENMDLLSEQRQKNIDFVQEHWFRPNADNFGDPLLTDFYGEVIECPAPLPLALSAAVLFDDAPRDSEGTPGFEYLYYVNIFSNGGKTHVHLAALKQQSDRLRKIAESFEANGEIATQFIEEWMIKATDHWYITPSFWDGLEANVRRNVLDSLNASIMKV